LDIAALKDQLGHTNLQLSQLKDDGEKLRRAVREDKEGVRQTNANLKQSQEEIQKTNTVVNIIEHRLTDTTASLATARKNLEDVNEVTVKLHECHEKTRTGLQELKEHVRKINTGCKENRDCVERLKAQQSLGQNRQSTAVERLDQLSKDADEFGRQLSMVKQGQNMSQGQIQKLKEELAEVDATTRKVKAGLKETSSYLLPNIGADSFEARQAFQRHGSILETGATARSGTANSKSSPKASAWT